MSTITADTMTALAADLTSAVKDIRRARLAFRATIKAIRDAGDWTRTEHKSWTTFAAEVVGAALPKSTAAIDWTIIAVACAEEGMSVRTIAPVVGKSKSAVSRVVREAIADGDADLPEETTGKDGNKRKASRAARTGSKSTDGSGAASGKGEVTSKVSPLVAAIAAAKEAAQGVRRAHKDAANLSAAQKRAQVNALRATAANLLQEADALEADGKPASKAA